MPYVRGAWIDTEAGPGDGLPAPWDPAYYLDPPECEGGCGGVATVDDWCESCEEAS